jgi:hypothetical protein
MSNLHNLTVAQLREVVAIKEQIEKLQGELDSIVGGEEPPAEAPAVRGPGRPRRRRMSPAARAAIGAAQRARWAKTRGEAPAEAAAPVEKKKRKVSAAARAKLAAAARARWAKVKASGKTKL